MAQCFQPKARVTPIVHSCSIGSRMLEASPRWATGYTELQVGKARCSTKKGDGKNHACNPLEEERTGSQMTKKGVGHCDSRDHG